MCEPRPEKNIIQLIGKENKKQARITHQAIQKAFKGDSRGGGKNPKKRSPGRSLNWFF